MSKGVSYRSRHLLRQKRGPALLATVFAVSCSAAQASALHIAPTELGDLATCQIVDDAAHRSRLSPSLLTRLVWTESHFQADAISSAGAQGIAQFMPVTAIERGLADPFDPAQAIPKAARLLSDLTLRFGNIGLAAAAYHAGPGRVGDWLRGQSPLPSQTQTYVLGVTGRSVEDWASGQGQPMEAEDSNRQSCVEIVGELRARRREGVPLLTLKSTPFGDNPFVRRALASFDRARQRYCRKLGNAKSIIVSTARLDLTGRPVREILAPAELSRARGRGLADPLCQS